MNHIIKLAIVGGSRGAYLTPIMSTLENQAQLVAVCDSNEESLQRWKNDYPFVRTYNDFNKLLDDPEVDAVFIATPLFLHAQQSIAALRAGKHVLSEVIAAYTLDEAWELIETVEKTKLTYMMAENYCFMRGNMMLKNMTDNGVFGDIVHAEGGYIHDCRYLFHYPNGELTWRGKLHRDYSGNTYPTHSFGPVAQWLGINEPGGDELDTLMTLTSRSLSTGKYFLEHFGSDHPGSSPDYWNQGDSTVTLLRTKKGVLVTLRYDTQSVRPHNMTHYALQGTKGAYLSPRAGGEEPVVWIEGLSPGQDSHSAQWESLFNHAEQWEHPAWREWGKAAEETGHWGGDFFILREFISAITEKRKPLVDVYDAITWSAISPLSLQSVAGGGSIIQMPKFNKNKRA